jgi:hypothetical protein
MAKLKSILGYTVAVLGIPLMIFSVLAFSGVVPLGKSFITATGLKTSANWTGGEVVRTIEHGAYQTDIHRPVFDALIGEHKEGFIQVAWRPPEALPAFIDEEIDFDADGQADFRIELQPASKQATITSYSPNVTELEGVYDLGAKLAIRVKIKNPSR